MDRRRRAGMTLVEVLVTLAIVGIMASMVVLGLGTSDRGLRVQAEAARLSDRLSLAVDEALVTQRPIALTWDAGGYGFVTKGTDGNWSGDPHAMLERHDFPAGVTLRSQAPGLIMLGDGSASTAFRMALGDGDRSWVIAFDGLAARASAAGAAT